jgi:pimeloyl-ACP methyl ester carboxylesterase
MTRQRPARDQLLADLPVAERRLSLFGAQTAVLEGGEGAPLVLLHGPASYAAAWLRVIPGLVTGWRVIAPDLPGHGASEPFAPALDVERVMGWLDDLIECTCAAPPVLVGHAIGGAIAARYAAEHGERLGGVVLVDTFGLRPLQPDPGFGAAIQAFMTGPSEQAFDRLWSFCAFDVAALRRALGAQWPALTAYSLDRAYTPGLLAGQYRFIELFGMPAIEPTALARIAVPTALIWGRHDLATPLSVAAEAGARVGWPLHVIDDAGDEPSMEQPEAFLSVLRSALGAMSRPELAR